MEITPPTSSSTFRSLYQFDLEEGSTFVMTQFANLYTYSNDTQKTTPESKSAGLTWYNNKYYVCGSQVTSSNSAYRIIEQNETSWNKDLWTTSSNQYPGIQTTYMADNRGIVFINDTLVNVGVTGYLLPLNADLLSYTTDDGFNKAASISGTSERPVTDACWAQNYLWITANRTGTSGVEPKIYKYDYSGKTIKSTIKLPSTYDRVFGICHDGSSFWLLARRNTGIKVLLKMTI